MLSEAYLGDLPFGMKFISEDQYIHVKKNKMKKRNRAIQVSDAAHAKSNTHAGAEDLIICIEAVPLTEDLVYDTYPQVVAKLQEFLTRDVVTNKMMCKVLGGISLETLAKFL